MTLRHWEISSRSFEGTCSIFMSVASLRELTSSRISSPLKFLRNVENRLHSTASYCRQTESSAAPLATYVCMSLAAMIKFTSERSVVAFEVTCSKKWCPVCVNKLGGVIALAISIAILFFIPTYKSEFRGTHFYPINQVTFWTITNTVILLTWIGARPVEDPYILTGRILTVLYFIYYVVNPITTKVWNKITD